MNWYKIKTIMIFSLLFINVFLVVFLVKTTYQEKKIPKKLITASIDVLKQNNLQCSEEIFPKTKPTLPHLNVKYYLPSELCDIFFKKQIAFRTDEETLIAQHNGETLEIKDNYFCYKTSKKAQKYSDQKYKATLNKLGFNMKSVKFDDDKKIFYKYYKKTKLSDVYLKVMLDENGEICFVESVWPKSMKAISRERISFSDKIIKASKEFPEGGIINEIKVVYSPNKKVGTNNYFAPCWKVVVNNKPKVIK